jgi:hypothetical protein
VSILSVCSEKIDSHGFARRDNHQIKVKERANFCKPVVWYKNAAGTAEDWPGRFGKGRVEVLVEIHTFHEMMTPHTYPLAPETPHTTTTKQSHL